MLRTVLALALLSCATSVPVHDEVAAEVNSEALTPKIEGTTMLFPGEERIKGLIQRIISSDSSVRDADAKAQRAVDLAERLVNQVNDLQDQLNAAKARTDKMYCNSQFNEACPRHKRVQGKCDTTCDA